MEYQKLRVWRSTNKKLKILAAKKEISVIKLIDELVKAEEKKTK